MSINAATLEATRRAPLESLLDPKGSAAYLLSDLGSWAVDAGPVADARFRAAAVETLKEALAGFDPVQGAALLASERVRVVGGVSESSAAALVARLGPQATGAKAVPQAALAVPSAHRGGIPLLGGAGVLVGVGLAVSWLIGAIAGVAVGAGLAMLNRKRPTPVLGSPPEGPALPGPVLDAIRQLQSGTASLAPSVANAVTSSGRVLLRLADHMLDEGDFIAIATGGVDSPTGEASFATLTALGKAVRGLSHADPARMDAAVTALAAAARATAATLDHVGEALKDTPGTAATQLDALGKSIESLRAAVDAVGATST
ncbi:MAG: hypothetical protein IV100_14130 [Myxococcales bacterium]|nr:hypothetical protein [Myxococcales bacterium]